MVVKVTFLLAIIYCPNIFSNQVSLDNFPCELEQKITKQKTKKWRTLSLSVECLITSCLRKGANAPGSILSGSNQDWTRESRGNQAFAFVSDLLVCSLQQTIQAVLLHSYI